MGGGILPVAIKNNKVYFLFGKENELDDTPGWADFGGGKEEGESYLDTALREGSEEINGFLGSAEKLRSVVKKNKQHQHKNIKQWMTINYCGNE